MKRQESERMKQARVKLSSAVGVTMVEMLLVIAIIGILSGVAFIAVWNYQRSMGQLERDNIAKEIFIAAQNHLTVAKGEGYRGVTDYGTSEDSGKDVFYYVVNNGAASSGGGMFAQMLPFGSIDETVRGGGSYLIRYQPKMGLVLDVFYCSTSGSPSKFNHTLSEDEYSHVMGLKGNDHKGDRRTYEYGDNSILGWYGGEDAANLPSLTLSPPDIKVLNRETLSVKVKDTSISSGGALRLLVKGVKSEVEHYLNITTTMTTDSEGYYTLVLDDITSQSQNLHFCKRHYDDMGASLLNGFIPGEDITVQAVAYSTTALANISYSAALTTNSLFASVNDSNSDGVPDTAYISNFRHLENLDKDISGLGYKDGITYSSDVGIVSAVQNTDLNWTYDSENNLVATYWTTVTVTDVDGIECASAGCYVPISPQNEGKIGGYSCTYNGKNHSISNVTASDTASDTDAGLFGNASYMSQISNLELIDFTVTGTTSAGALAGTLSGCTVTNVLARNSTTTSSTATISITASSAATISAPTAGGLVGSIGSGTTIQYSAAAVVVSGSTNAGGLIGQCTGADASSSTKEIVGCYSGGHTKNGSYELWLNKATPDDATDDPPYDVTGATAGGLIGDAGSATISNSYSTCSVSGTSSGTSKSGGFVGSASGSGSITNCYATGLMKKTLLEANVAAGRERDANNSVGAFAGSFTGTAENCSYYSIINEVRKKEQTGDKTTLDHYLGAVGDTASTSGITAFDLNADTYNTFTGAWDDWNAAAPYDNTLVQYYKVKYPLKAVDEWDSSELPTGYTSWNQLFAVTHYGDWPSPEVFFINTK